MYVDDNDGYFPARTTTNRWPMLLRDGYKDWKVLLSPTDEPNPAMFWPRHEQLSCDAAPRS